METTITNTVDDMHSDIDKAQLLLELGRNEELLKLLLPQVASQDEPEAEYRLSVFALQR